MHFDQLLEAATAGEVVLPEDWGQGRATFGGLLGALANQAMRACLSDHRPLRSLSVAFVGPAAPGEKVQIRAEVLRQGKSVTQIESRITQHGETVLVALGSYGHGRESVVQVPGRAAPTAPAPEKAPALPWIEGVTPAFTQHIAMHFGLGGFPFTGSESREMGGWMRFKEAPRAMTESHLIALADAWPPAVLPQLKKPAPASSLSWTLQIVEPEPRLASDDWLLYEASIDQAREGYGQTQAGIWSRDGQLLALSHQAVTVFA
ncbi:MAG: thioesterase family protein [Halomonadaceae bacterium]|nr:MAG: thioesterase family protein [Halomonadaceae bacterium]